MKKNSDIASLFQKHQAKKAAAAASASAFNHSPDPVERVVEERTHERIEEIANPMPPPQRLHRHCYNSDIFQVDEDDIIKIFMSLRKRRIK